jgi:hypothetical protein
MAFLHRALKVPALFRALADVAEQHPCLSPSLTVHESLDLLQSFGGNETTMAVSFSGDFVASSTMFRLALATAYKRYGGDPSLFIDSAELMQLEAIERAADRHMAADAKACGIEMEVTHADA